MNIQQRLKRCYTGRKMENKHVMYVLECADGTFYTGYTNYLEKRLATHNAGKGAKYTRARLPVKCVFVEEFETKQEAMRAEYYMKRKSRQQKIDYMKRGTRNEIAKK